MKFKHNSYLIRPKIKTTLISVFSMVLCFLMGIANGQNVKSYDNTTTEDTDWNIATKQDNTLTDEEKEQQEQQKLWDEWDAKNASDLPENTVVIYGDVEEEKNRVKSPNEILMETLVGNWEGFYGGSEAYINFRENKTVIINTSVFSNAPSASGKGYVQYYYEIDASKSPYRLIFYNRDREIKGVFRINNTNSITLCHNFKDDKQPKEIDNKYTILNFSKMQIEENNQEHSD
ncbi:hypothetical protein [Bernardetia sp.]|uniref:hypothetical protein n=1 Tax=Bernardetia sp. TaxID=1937974 RepID=UPI0025BDDF55|nr:hypothetical protein [Bernardetia sp.]